MPSRKPPPRRPRPSGRPRQQPPPRSPRPATASAPQQPPKQGQKTKVRAHKRVTRTGVVDVSEHERRIALRQARAAWAAAGISGLTTVGLIFQFGFGVVSVIALALTALCTWLAVWLTQKTTANKRKLKAAAAAKRSKKL